MSFDPRTLVPRAGELVGRVIAITGASDGMGKAVALACARHRAQLVLIGRSAAKLQSVHREIEGVADGAASIGIRDLESAGRSDRTPRQLSDLRIGRITAQKIDEYRKLGYPSLTVRELSDFGIHGVTPKFIEELRALGYDKLSPRQLIDMRIFGVTPDYIRKINSLGYSNVPVEKLLKLKMSGADEVLLMKK